MGTINFYHIDRQITFGVATLNHASSWILGTVYASTSVFQHHFLWSQIHDVLSLQVPLLLIEDFNYILNTVDKKGGKLFTIDCDIREFYAFL